MTAWRYPIPSSEHERAPVQPGQSTGTLGPRAEPVPTTHRGAGRLPRHVPPVVLSRGQGRNAGYNLRLPHPQSHGARLRDGIDRVSSNGAVFVR
jgi:hypothetical protein